MSGPSPSGIKRCFPFIACLAASALITALFLASGVIAYWNRGLYDLFIQSRVRGAAVSQSPVVAAIDLNDISEKVLGESLDTRRAFADTLEVLTEANAAAAFDFLFRREKEEDAAFVRAVENGRDTVLAALAVDARLAGPYTELSEDEKTVVRRSLWHIKVRRKGTVPEAGTFLLPLPDLGAAAQIGHINVAPDTDGVYRRVHLLYQWEDGFIPSLPLAAAVFYLGVDIETIELTAGSYLCLPLSETELIRIPIDESGSMLIPYTAAWTGSMDRIPIHKLVEAKYNPDVFDDVFLGLQGRAAIIAEITTGQKDFGPAPFERLFPLSGIHAAVLGGILDGLEPAAFITPAPFTHTLIALLLIVFAALCAAQAGKDAVFHGVFLLVFAAYSGLTLFRWHAAAVFPDFALPAVSLFCLWFSGFCYRLIRRYNEQALLKNALSRYFPRSLAERIMNERKTELIPAYKELAILFSDISGFTKWSSDKSPEMVHSFLSEYLESMAAILFAHGGTVDKFMGDGILAFFGDPVDLPDHAERCVRAAIAMQEKIRELAVKWKPLADIDLKVRMGINTGKVIVGNLGTKTRIEYTVIGAAVNLAQRMESSAPVGGILVTAAAKEKVSGLFMFSDRRLVAVKGYEDAVEAYEVTAP